MFVSGYHVILINYDYVFKTSELVKEVNCQNFNRIVDSSNLFLSLNCKFIKGLYDGNTLTKLAKYFEMIPWIQVLPEPVGIVTMIKLPVAFTIMPATAD